MRPIKMLRQLIESKKKAEISTKSSM